MVAYQRLDVAELFLAKTRGASKPDRVEPEHG